MFESGLDYVRADFHLHTKRDKEFEFSGSEHDFVKNYVEELKRAGIGIGVITNHNKFDIDEYKAISKAARKNNIFILPGVELTIKEGANGVHTLIVFNPDEWISQDNHIQSFLTAAFVGVSNPENSNAKCIYDIKNALEKLDEYGRDYFLIFAHVDQASGLFAECKGGILDSMNRLPPFKSRVLGLQKSRTHDNLKKFFECFNYYPALLEGSDPKSLSEIGRGDKKTYLKLGEYSYSAVKFALQDCENRVYGEIPKVTHGYIESISFQGGKFDGQTINFSSGLNTLIGIRGSGKSSVLESIRYIFKLDAQADQEYKESLVKNTFGSGGKATLTVADKYGKKYTISRIFNDRTNILDENEKDLNVTPLSLFDGVQYFEQKDLSSSTNHEDILLAKLAGSKINQVKSQNQLTENMVTVIKQLLAIAKVPEEIDDAKARRSVLTHKIKIYREKGIDEKLGKQSGYSSDKNKLASVKNTVNHVLDSIRTMYEKDSSVSVLLQDYTSIYNQDLIDETKSVLSCLDKRLVQIGESIDNIQNDIEDITDIENRLTARIDALAEEFAEIKRQINDDTVDADSFLKMTNDVEEIDDYLQNLDKQTKIHSNLEEDFLRFSRERNELLHGIFNQYLTEIKSINASQSEIKLEITYKGDKEDFKRQMKSDFKGTGISDSKYQTMSEEFMDYIDLIEDWILKDGKSLREILSNTEYNKLNEKLMEQYVELVKREVPNLVDIYYHNKLLKKHSIGQRASALILFILTQYNNDIIFIDQPEDDLDSKTIYDEVITTIKARKSNTQFIFATHNANIPVLGDAERVLATDYQDTLIDIKQGNIDQCSTQKQIIDIMEGGEEAFERRKMIYSTWK